MKEKSPLAVTGPCPPVPAETGGWNAKALQLFDDIAAQGEKVIDMKFSLVLEFVGKLLILLRINFYGRNRSI